jgi:mRNA interferase RelE/StbE
VSRPVVVTARAKRDLERLDRAVADRVIRALERLADTGAGDVRKLSGTAEKEWRLRVGDWRVRFTCERGGIVVLRVQPRGRVYR